MDDPNPYAAPGVADSESPGSRYWQVCGVDILAKNGATLPELDLDTGAAEGPLKALPRSYDAVHPASMLTGLLLVFAYLYLSRYHLIGPAVLIPSFVVSLILIRRLAIIRGFQGRRVLVWIFVDARRFKRLTLRRRCRIAAMLLVFFAIVASIASPAVSGSLRLSSFPGFFDIWVYRVLPAGVIIILALAIWAALDRGRIRIGGAAPGWIRISRIHPAALARLREIETSQIESDTPRAGRQRRVRKSYFHRYPLHLLIGRNWHKPLIVLNLCLMKLFRSPWLTRETYHYSEAEKTLLPDLVEPLRAATGEWLATHPDWTFVTGEHLPSPAGDLMFDSALLASPGFEHGAYFTHTWLTQKPAEGITQARFTTWTQDSGIISTVDHATIKIPASGEIEYRAKGSREQAFQSHLQHCAGASIHPANDLPDFIRRFEAKREESDLLLTRAGYQGEATDRRETVAES